MTTHSTNVSTTNHEGTRVLVASERGPSLLTETELDDVAAAGSKPGGMTDGRGLPGSPFTNSA